MWKTIPNSTHEINIFGEVRTFKKEIKKIVYVRGIPSVYLEGSKKPTAITVLLCRTFHKNPYKKAFVRQLDDDHSILDLSRLVWEPVTSKAFTDLNGETWVPLFGNDKYQISDVGRIRRMKSSSKIKQGTIRAARPDKDGYFYTVVDGKGIRINRYVLASFTNKLPSDKEAAHKNGKKKDNRLTNLYWASSQQNAKDKIRHGTQAKHERNGSAILTKKIVKRIRTLYKNGSHNQRELGKKFKTTQSNISNIILDKSWVGI